MKTELLDAEKALNFYKTACLQAGPDCPLPQWIPATVLLVGTVRGDGPFSRTVARAGEYPCTCNSFGAVSIVAENGSKLGLRLYEFEPLTWIENPDYVPE